MKKILILALAVILALSAVSCAAKPQNIEDSKSGTEVVLDKTKFNLGVKGKATPFDHMSNAAFRKELRPYLEAWYEFCYKEMWWTSLNIDTQAEPIESDVGEIYLKLADFNTQTSLEKYLSSRLSYDVYGEIIKQQTLENESGLYVLEIAAGWQGTPDYNSCQLVASENGKYYVSFKEENELYSDGQSEYVVVFEIRDGRLLVTDYLSYAQGLEFTVGKVLSDGIKPDLMTISEFRDFVSLLMYRYGETEGHVNFDESSVKLCTDEWVKLVEGASYAAEVMINGKLHYAVIGADINGIYSIIGISKA